MAACGSLEHIFDKALHESPTLRQSLSPWKHLKPIEDTSPSFTEFFREPHFKENATHHSPSSSSSSSSFPIDFSTPVGNAYKEENNDKKIYVPSKHRKHYNRNSHDSFSSMNSESLSLCTEGLGFESCDDIEDTANSNEWKQREAKTSIISRHTSMNEYLSGKRSRITGGEFPPPISCIGSSGKPWVCFKSFRHNGRFILKEVRIPTQEFLHACREDGRLKLHFIQSDDDDDDDDDDDETIEEGEDEGQDDDDEDCSDECAQSFAHDDDENYNNCERVVEEEEDDRGQILIGN